MTGAAGPSRGSERHPRVGLPVGIGLGASAGGPVRIPGLFNGKDRLFFFLSYDRLVSRFGCRRSTSSENG